MAIGGKEEHSLQCSTPENTIKAPTAERWAMVGVCNRIPPGAWFHSLLQEVVATGGWFLWGTSVFVLDRPIVDNTHAVIKPTLSQFQHEVVGKCSGSKIKLWLGMLLPSLPKMKKILIKFRDLHLNLMQTPRGASVWLFCKLIKKVKVKNDALAVANKKAQH